MTNIIIKNIPNLEGVEFEFNSVSPLNLDPNKSFPKESFQDGEIPITSIKAKASEEFPIGGAKEIKFGIDAGGYAALGVYRDSTKLLKALENEGLSEQLRNLLNLTIADEDNLLALRWGYDFKASIDGKVGLFSAANPVKLNFGASGKTLGKSVLLHSVRDSQTIADSLKETLSSWKVPRQVKSINDLNPKTTIIFETMGNLNIALGVEYGYDFNWVREEVKIGNLSGDLGLKIEMGVKAQFGFNAAGGYALALSRESDAETIRVQVFNMKQSGWSFAFDGGFSAQAEKVPFPDNIDDFVKGIFNLNGSQILKDFEKWTDKNTKIEDLLGKELEKYSKNLIKKVTGIDPDESLQKLKEALDGMKSLITKWNDAPHEITSYLYGLLSKTTDKAKLEGELKALKEFLQKIKDAEKPESAAAEIQKHLEKIEFFTTPIGKWLTAASKQGILSLLANIKSERKQLADAAKKTLSLLDGGEVEEKLKRLQEEIDEKLNLDVIKNLDPEEWDELLVKRLKDFIGVGKVADELEKIKKAINKTREQAGEFYKKGYDALLKKYSFQVNYAFQKSTANNALIDLTIDFSGENKSEAEKYLEEVLDGNFQKILTDTEIKCLKLNQAVLTHEIKRNVHLGVNIPYFSATLDHITNSVAGKKYVETADGKLWVYYVNAEDIVKKKKSLSRLAIAAELTEKAGIRKFSEENNELNYSFLYGKRKVHRKYIDQRYDFAATTYLRSAFTENSFDKYLTDLDKYLDTNGYPESDEFGSVLTSLKVSLPGNVMSIWEKVPEDYDAADFYKRLSARIQSALREWIPLNYIQEAKQYDKTGEIFPLLAYMSLNPLIGKRKSQGVFYWDYSDDSKKEELFNSFMVQENLRKILRKVQQETSNTKYKETNENIKAILEFVLQNSGGKGLFHDLCDLEEDLIKGVVETIKAFHKFNTENDSKEKVKALAEFGSKFTDTFNDEIGHIKYTPKGSLRPLGLLLFLKIAQILEPSLDEANFAAMFEIFVLNPEISDQDFNKLREQFLEGNFDEEKQKFVLRQRIVNVDSSLM